MTSVNTVKPNLSSAEPKAVPASLGRKPGYNRFHVSATPQNTPASGPPIGIVARAKPIGKPINAANAIFGRGTAPTPGNTPNSLEVISHRIAQNLTLGNTPMQQSNRIAPSYE
jgi:hypothetical protein